MKCHFCGVTIMVGEPGVRTDNCCVYHENMLGCVLALRTSLTKAEGEVTAWKDRFRAIVGDDSPDGAGNRVITLQSDLRTLRGGEDQRGGDGEGRLRISKWPFMGASA